MDTFFSEEALRLMAYIALGVFGGHLLHDAFRYFISEPRKPAPG